MIGQLAPGSFYYVAQPRVLAAPATPVLDLVWRKLADGPTSERATLVRGLPARHPYLDIAQVRYRPTSETVSRRGMASLLWLLSRASFHRLGDQGKSRDWGGGDGVFRLCRGPS